MPSFTSVNSLQGCNQIWMRYVAYMHHFKFVMTLFLHEGMSAQSIAGSVTDHISIGPCKDWRWLHDACVHALPLLICCC